MDLADHRQTVAHALSVLESSIERLVDALAHRPAWVSADGARVEREALAMICTAYSTIDYRMEDAVGTSVVCLGVVGVGADVLKRAQAVNQAKAGFKAVCTPLQHIRTRVASRSDGGAGKAIPVIRAVLRGIQRSDLNLLAAYRKIPLLEVQPQSITYTRARTRAVYRKSIEDLYNLLLNAEGPSAAADRARLSNLPRQEKFLAIARPHYDNIRANIVHARLDSRGRGRVQIAAELPLMFANVRRHAPPQVNYPAPPESAEGMPRRVRQSNLEPEPYLQTLPAYRYVHRQ